MKLVRHRFGVCTASTSHCATSFMPSGENHRARPSDSADWNPPTDSSRVSRRTLATIHRDDAEAERPNGHLDVAAAWRSSRRPTKLKSARAGPGAGRPAARSCAARAIRRRRRHGRRVSRVGHQSAPHRGGESAVAPPGGRRRDSMRRFQTEARSAARLDHPNIARVHYVGEDRGIRYIVFEYIEGTNIRDLVHANGPLPVADALSYTLQIANALAHAWEREVVHRDIKPSNILITQDGLAKLVDMGLARLESLDRRATTTKRPPASRSARSTTSRRSRPAIRATPICAATSIRWAARCFSCSPAGRRLPKARCCRSCLLHQTEAPPDVRDLRPDVPDELAGVLVDDAGQAAGRPVSKSDRALRRPDFAAWNKSVWRHRPSRCRPTGSADLPRQAGGGATRPGSCRPCCCCLSVLILGVIWNREAAAPAFPELQIPETMTPTDNGVPESNRTPPLEPLSRTESDVISN